MSRLDHISAHTHTHTHTHTHAHTHKHTHTHTQGQHFMWDLEMGYRENATRKNDDEAGSRNILEKEMKC